MSHTSRGIGKGTIAFLIVSLFLGLTGCTPKLIVYHNAKPEIANLAILECSSGIQAAAAFVRYTEIREENETAYWPEGLPLETKVGIGRKSGPMELRLRIANGPRREITVVYREQIYSGNKLLEDKSVTIYSGKLPYRDYSVPLPKKGGERVEAWFEIFSSITGEIPCFTGRAIYYVIPKDKSPNYR